MHNPQKYTTILHKFNHLTRWQAGNNPFSHSFPAYPFLGTFMVTLLGDLVWCEKGPLWISCRKGPIRGHSLMRNSHRDDLQYPTVNHHSTTCWRTGQKRTTFWGPSLIGDPDSRSLLESVENLQFNNYLILVFSVAVSVSGHLFLIRKNFLSWIIFHPCYNLSFPTRHDVIIINNLSKKKKTLVRVFSKY